MHNESALWSTSHSISSPAFGHKPQTLVDFTGQVYGVDVGLAHGARVSGSTNAPEVVTVGVALASCPLADVLVYAAHGLQLASFTYAERERE